MLIWLPKPSMDLLLYSFSLDSSLLRFSPLGARSSINRELSLTLLSKPQRSLRTTNLLSPGSSKVQRMSLTRHSILSFPSLSGRAQFGSQSWPHLVSLVVSSVPGLEGAAQVLDRPKTATLTQVTLMTKTQAQIQTPTQILTKVLTPAKIPIRINTRIKRRARILDRLTQRRVAPAQAPKLGLLRRLEGHLLAKQQLQEAGLNSLLEDNLSLSPQTVSQPLVNRCSQRQLPNRRSRLTQMPQTELVNYTLVSKANRMGAEAPTRMKARALIKMRAKVPLKTMMMSLPKPIVGPLMRIQRHHSKRAIQRPQQSERLLPEEQQYMGKQLPRKMESSHFDILRERGDKAMC
jgi:hypothetical protein